MSHVNPDDGTNRSEQPDADGDWWDELGDPEHPKRSVREELVQKICASVPHLRQVVEDSESVARHREAAREHALGLVVAGCIGIPIYPDPVFVGIAEGAGYREYTSLFDIRVPSTARSLALVIRPRFFAALSHDEQLFDVEALEVDPGAVLLGVSCVEQMGLITERLFVSPEQFEQQCAVALSDSQSVRTTGLFAACIRSAIAIQYGDVPAQEQFDLGLYARNQRRIDLCVDVPHRQLFATVALSNACVLSAVVREAA